jgi:hypothetical protein
MHTAWFRWSFLIPGILTAALGIVLLAVCLIALLRWSKVAAEVIESSVLGPDANREYSANITVRWTINGPDHSKKVNNWGNGTGRASFEAVVAQYPKAGNQILLSSFR